MQCSGIIQDKNNMVVAEFSSNHLGIGSFYLEALANETYTAKIKLAQNTELHKTLPKAKQVGFNIVVDNIQRDSVYINIHTNKATLTTTDKDTFTLFIHKDGQSKTIPLSINDVHISQAIAKKEIFNGINTVTLFKNRVPIAERMFFNEYFLRKQRLL